MPYIRFYSQELPIEQRGLVAQKLIEITLRAFRLRANDRYQTSVQFITLPRVLGVVGRLATPHNADFTLEVLGHRLSEEKKKAFAKEARAMLGHFPSAGLWERIASVFGIKVHKPKQVALQFHELSPAISDPYVVHSDHLVA
jgi:hypothetical protein